MVVSNMDKGETLHTCSQIVSALFSLPYLTCLRQLQVHQATYLDLTDRSRLKIMIVDLDTYRYINHQPDLIIHINTDTRPLSYSSNLSDSTVQISLDHCPQQVLPIQEGAPLVYPFPVHHHLMCLSYHLSHLFVACVDKSAAKLRETLVECNRSRLRMRDEVDCKVLTSFDELSIHEMDLFC